MINQYPLWKQLLIGVVLLIGTLYALPNLYGEDPAVQVNGTRNTKVDAALRDKVEAALKKANIAIKSITLDKGELLARFPDTETQLKAVDTIEGTVGDNYVVALNLAATTPAWLQAINAQPMYLGLDLRGGVHFLLQVDMDAAARLSAERYVGDIRALLRKDKVRYLTLARDGDVVRGDFKDAAEREKARARIYGDYPNLVITDKDVDGHYYLNVALSEQEQREMRKFAIEQNITTLRNRVNELGVAEPIIQQQGQDRIVVQLPGVQDTARAKKILGATATLEYRLVDVEHSVQDAVAGHVPPGSKLYYSRDGAPVLLEKRVIVTGDQITHAASGLDQNNGTPMVSVNLDSKGAKKMGDITRDNIGRPMAVVFIENKVTTKMVNGKPVKTSKQVEEVINVATIRDSFSNRFQTTGLDSTEEARDLALLLRAGSLSVPSQIIEERTVGPSLGVENIRAGFHSTLIGFAAIALFMMVYYRMFGVIAILALSANVLLLVALLSMLQATLTLPGIAGIALTVGIAIDANVLIFERIREELRNGNSPQASIHAGYDRALDTIIDSNVTTLIAGFALFMLGSGPIRGFAVVLCLGIMTSMFTGVMVSRVMVNLIFGQRKLASLPI